MRYSLLGLGLLGTCLSLVSPIQAQQVVSDGTLNTIVTRSNNNFIITNGSTAGTNLFHSFREFSIPTNGSASFDLASTPQISTIFSRVTGGTISHIDGAIRTLNSRNPVSLFLMNPSGILFSANASLNLSGSFIGTTADSIQFQDGTLFRATTLAASPLLTISAPIGLQIGQSPGSITVQNHGHQIRFPSTFAPVVEARPRSTGLRVNSNQTLALIGGNVVLSGALLNAPQIELGSVANGTVNLDATVKGYTIDYSNIQTFRDLQLTSRSAIDASGLGDATIQLVGRNIALTQGSIALMVNSVSQPGGNLRITAAESFQLSGHSAIDPNFGSFLISDAFAGSSANISISAPQIRMFDRGIVATRTFGNATGGSIKINASDIQIDGALDNSFDLHSGFLPTALGQGNMGNFMLSSRTLSLLNGGYINSSTAGAGNGAEVLINVDRINIDGVNSFGQSSLIAAASFAKGNAGNLTINTRQIALTNGGTASTSTFNDGKAGNVTINATESITVLGRLVPSGFSSTDGVSSSANILPLPVRQLIGLPDRPIGDSGDAILTTKRLFVAQGGAVKVNNQGLGSAGTIRINADTIALKDQGSITAATAIKGGGNIDLNAQTLLMRSQSSITATADGLGNGGNLHINAPVIVGLENSDIVANALQGRGGNITITTKGMFGLQNRDASGTRSRDRLTADSDITASSEFGISGSVQVDHIGVDLSSGLVALSETLVDAKQQIAAGCSTSQASRFIMTGRGGMPANPTEQIRGDRTWVDLRDPGTFQRSMPPMPLPKSLIEATSWKRDLQTGKIELIAAQAVRGNETSVNCASPQS